MRLLENHPTHYVVTDGKRPFRIPKEGLSPAMHGKIQALADGGDVAPKFGDVGPRGGTMTATGVELGGVYGNGTRIKHNGYIAYDKPKPKTGPMSADEAAAEKKSHDAWVAGGGKVHEVGKFAEGGAVRPAEVVADPFPDSGIDWDAIGRALRGPNAGKSPMTGQPLPAPAPVAAPAPAAPPDMPDEQRQANTAALMNAPSVPPPMLARPPEQQAAPVEYAESRAQTAPAVAKAEKPAAPVKSEEERALEAQAEVARKRAAIDAEANVARGRVYESAAAQDEKAHLEARAQAAQDFRRIQEAQDSIAKIDTNVDPNRWWASRSTPGKIMGAIGLMLGAIGAGRDGVNRSVAVIDQAIDRDIDAQKTEHQFRMAKGQAALQGAQSAYALHHQAAQDETVARAATKASLLQLAENRIDQTRAATANPAIQAQLDMAKAELHQKQRAALAAAAEVQFKNALEAKKVDIQAAEAEAKLMEQGKKGSGAYVGQGKRLMPGAELRLEELSKYREEVPKLRQLNNDVEYLRDAWDTKKPWGNILPGEQKGRIQAASARLIPQILGEEGLKRMSAEDIKLFREINADPTSLWNMTPGRRAQASAALGQFLDSANSEMREREKFLGIEDDAPARGGAVGAVTATNAKGQKVTWDGSAWRPL